MRDITLQYRYGLCGVRLPRFIVGEGWLHHARIPGLEMAAGTLAEGKSQTILRLIHIPGNDFAEALWPSFRKRTIRLSSSSVLALAVARWRMSCVKKASR